MVDAIKEIRTKIPEVVELYSIGVRSTSMASVVHLNQEIEASSPAMPEVNHPKSHAGIEIRWFYVFKKLMLSTVIC